MPLDLPVPENPLSVFLDAYALTGAKDQKGYHRLKWTLLFWKEKYGSIPVSQITRRQLSLHIETRRMAGKSNSTINREISILSASINYAIKRWDWNIRNPATGLYLKTPEGRLRWLSGDEYHRLIKSANEGRCPHLVDFINMAIYTGMRRGEILNLQTSRIDLLNKVIQLDGSQTKNGKRRVIPLNKMALTAITNRMQWNDEHGVTGSRLFLQKNGKPVVQINTAFTNAMHLANIEDFRLHDLRHTFASWLVSSGVSLPEIRDLLGHSSIKQTERYAHLATARLHQAVAVLDPPAGLSNAS